ncbi:MAG: hypothetical protein M1816_007393 [Peltula sp. TS41687]|nr:MAG: hypothetical protein M1816_007393 [Peltula sp. TS41687]
MSLFPGFPAPTEFGPLFRLLDDYDSHRSGRGHSGSAVRGFQPKFDVRETKEAYELHGELPGIDQKDISIEFSDPTTLVIKGRVEREYSAGGPEGQQQQGRITGDVTDQQNQNQTQSHKATVEDEGQEGGQSEQQQQQDDNNKQVQQQQKGDQHVARKGHQHAAKYWVSERSVGEFYRSFSFPTRVDQDNVKANLKNGILTIHVPKAAAHQAKKISIE